MMLVGITGFAGSGKDTAAQALLDIGWERRAFADPMRDGLLGVDPIVNAWYHHVDGITSVTVEHLSEVIERIGWDRTKREYPEVRRLLQAYGTEGGRDVHGQNCWVNAIEDTLLGGVDYVFTDVRFPNERDFIQEQDGIVIRICRDGVDAVNAHASEQVLDNIDVGIYNNGSIEELHHEVLLAVTWHLHSKMSAHIRVHEELAGSQRPIQFGGVQIPELPSYLIDDPAMWERAHEYFLNRYPNGNGGIDGGSVGYRDKR